MKNPALAAILSLALCAPALAVDKKAIVEHIRESYPNIPAGLEITLGDPKPSEVSGLDVMEMSISRQKENLYISKDGRYYVLGGFKDLKTSPDKERMAKMKVSGSPTRGNKSAKVQVVEYTDFQCPYCQFGYRVMRDDIMKQYGSKIEWIYKSLPLKEIHPWAETAAIGAECAHNQGDGQFWALHDVIFDAQKFITARNVDLVLDGFVKGEDLDTVLPGIKQAEAEADPRKKDDVTRLRKVYPDIRTSLRKIDKDKFKACYLGKETAQVVDKDLSEAGSLGINGTPAFLINGRLISGADGESIKQLIEATLKKSEKS